MLFAIDGIDGAGKTTQCALLEEFLNNQDNKCVTIKEPFKNGRFSNEIRNISDKRDLDSLLDLERELNLFVENRKDNVNRNIIPSLKKFDFVIMDRYYFSTIAYQSIFGLDPEYIKELNEKFAPIPDMTIILDVPVDVGLERISSRGSKISSFEKREYLDEVRINFLKMKYYNKLKIIDGAKAIEEVHNQIIGVLYPFLKKKNGGCKILVC